MRDLQYWRRFTRGEGRDIIPPRPQCNLHSDVADVGYGGTLGTDLNPGSTGLWDCQGLWGPYERHNPITMRELRAVRMTLRHHFSQFLRDPRTQHLLVHLDNQPVVRILKAMVSASPALISELRKLRSMLEILGIKIQSRWLPSAVNKYADALSRTWRPTDLRVTEQLVRDLKN